MTRETSQVLVAGPAVVERALGEKLTKEELGGAAVHSKSGVVDHVATDEDEVVELMRRFLGYLPSHVGELPPRRASADPATRAEEELLAIVPRNRRRVYDMRRLVRLVVDADSWFELTALFGRSQITGLARLDGTPVGVLANDPYHFGGAMTADGAQKVRRFVTLCETFHLPILSFVDEPGFMIGRDAEAAATIRHGVEAMCATVRSTVPWAAVLVRKAYGVAAAVHFGPAATVFAWPSGERGALPIEGGVAVAFRREIESAPHPEARRAELEELLARGRTPFPAAESFAVHDLIDPRRTRPEALCVARARPPSSSSASHDGRGRDSPTARPPPYRRAQPLRKEEHRVETRRVADQLSFAHLFDLGVVVDERSGNPAPEISRKKAGRIAVLGRIHLHDDGHVRVPLQGALHAPPDRFLRSLGIDLDEVDPRPVGDRIVECDGLDVVDAIARARRHAQRPFMERLPSGTTKLTLPAFLSEIAFARNVVERRNPFTDTLRRSSSAR